MDNGKTDAVEPTDRINKILNHDLFKKCCHDIKACEQDRIFCRHDMTHFLDVARLAMLFNEQQKAGIDKDLIYAAALLHDIGRHLQYTEGIPHQQASAKIAPEILRDCGYNGQETEAVIKAILDHRNAEVAQETSMSGMIYRADKYSRKCFDCDVRQECSRKTEKKNLQLIW